MSANIENRLVLTTWIRERMAQGRCCFTTDEAISALKKSPVAVRASLRRLKAKGLIASPVRGFNVMISPEYQSLGCLPPEQFISDLMSFLKQSYYAGLLTAAQFHGAAHQQPQEFQVVTSKNRKKITCGKVNIRFIARRNAQDIPKLSIKTPRGFMAISSPEVTAFDLILYPNSAGGISNVATVLSELSEKMDPEKLVGATKFISELSAIQRLGFLFEHILKKKRFALPLLNIVKKKVRAFVPLVPSAPKKGARPNERWKILINMKVESEV